eukprot:37446-Pleurochrysis_carterae.AAC.2
MSSANAGIRFSVQSSLSCTEKQSQSLTSATVAAAPCQHYQQSSPHVVAQRFNRSAATKEDHTATFCVPLRCVVSCLQSERRLAGAVDSRTHLRAQLVGARLGCCLLAQCAAELQDCARAACSLALDVLTQGRQLLSQRERLRLARADQTERPIHGVLVLPLARFNLAQLGR